MPASSRAPGMTSTPCTPQTIASDATARPASTSTRLRSTRAVLEPELAGKRGLRIAVDKQHPAACDERVEHRRSPRSWSSPPRPSAVPRLQPSRHLPLVDFTATRITGETSAVALERCSLGLGRDPKLMPQTLSARREHSTEPVPYPSGRFGWCPDNQLPGSVDCHELERSKPDREPALANCLGQQSANPLPIAPIIRWSVAPSLDAPRRGRR